MTTDRIQTHTDRMASHPPATAYEAGGAAIHPRFLRSGPWALSSVVALLFGLSFASSYAALYDYALELQFSREFAAAFPLVLDAVIIVLAVTLLLERALGRRTMTVMGWRFTVRLPTWPLLALWIYFAGSVAGNVGHAPRVLAAQFVAAVPPVSAALTFHLLLRLLDRAPALRGIAEGYEERSVDEQERAAARKARRARIKTGTPSWAVTALEPASAAPRVSGGRGAGTGSASGQCVRDGGDRSSGEAVDELAIGPATGDSENGVGLDELGRRVRAAVENGEPVTGAAVGRWLGLSERTGRRRLAALLDADPELTSALAEDDVG
jgi:hypothetical protein